MQIRISGNIYISDSFHIKAQSGADWAEPGFRTRTYRDCIPNHSEGLAGDDEMVPRKPLAKHPCSKAERTRQGDVGALQPLCRDALVSTAYKRRLTAGRLGCRPLRFNVAGLGSANPFCYPLHHSYSLLSKGCCKVAVRR